MNKLLGSIISKFDAEAKSHMEKQSLNPFSGNFSRSPSPRLSKDQYGKPLAGSKTEERGQKAKCHILREILDLCSCIHDLGVYNKTHKQKDDPDEEGDESNDDEIIITFGEIFQMYTKINDKVVGLLIAAKKRGFLFFEKEILFQRRDDDVLIALIMPIQEIRTIIYRELAVNASPMPQQSRGVSPALTDVSDSEKTASNTLNGNSKQPSKSSSVSPANEVSTSPKVNNPEPSKDQCDVKIPVETKEKDNVCLASAVEEENKPNTTVEKSNSTTSLDSHNNESPKTTNDLNTSPVPVILDELKRGERNAEDLEVQKTNVIQNGAAQENSIPSVEVISATDCSNIVLPSLVTEPTQEYADIPTIEISEADSSKQESNDEHALAEINVENSSLSNADIPNFNNNDASNESNVASEGIENIDHPMEINQHISDIQTPLSNASDDVKEVVPVEVVEPTRTEDSIALNLDITNSTQVSYAVVNDDSGRKRTLSNEELIESVTAPLSLRSSSPDPCDEEVEQILQSQTAINSILIDPLHELPENNESVLETTPEIDVFGSDRHSKNRVSAQDNVTDALNLVAEAASCTSPDILETNTEINISISPNNILGSITNENSDLSSSPKIIIERRTSLVLQILEHESESSITKTDLPSPDTTIQTQVCIADTNIEIEVPTSVPNTEAEVPIPAPFAEVEKPTSVSTTEVVIPIPVPIAEVEVLSPFPVTEVVVPTPVPIIKVDEVSKPQINN